MQMITDWVLSAQYEWNNGLSLLNQIEVIFIWLLSYICDYINVKLPKNPNEFYD